MTNRTKAEIYQAVLNSMATGESMQLATREEVCHAASICIDELGKINNILDDVFNKLKERHG